MIHNCIYNCTPSGGPAGAGAGPGRPSKEDRRQRTEDTRQRQRTGDRGLRDRRQKLTKSLGRVSKEKGRWRHRFSLQKKTMKWDRGQGRQEKARLTEDRETEDKG